MKKIIFVLSALLIFSGGNLLSAPTANAAQLNPQQQDSVVSPMVVFAPESCILANSVKRVVGGWEVTTPGGLWIYPLRDAARVGLKTPKKGDWIEIMTSSSGGIVGWKVL